MKVLVPQDIVIGTEWLNNFDDCVTWNENNFHTQVGKRFGATPRNTYIVRLFKLKTSHGKPK